MERELSPIPPVFPMTTPLDRPSVAPYAERVRRVVSPERFEHIKRVAVLADHIALANAFDRGERRATALAATLHDAARDMAPEDLFDLAPPESELEAQNPLSVHGRAGRALAERWGVRDDRVLDAIEGHVFGVTPDNRVGMAIYVADVSEPGRGVNGDIRDLAMVNLFRAYQRAVDSKVRYLQSKGKSVHPRTLAAYREVCAGL